MCDFEHPISRIDLSKEICHPLFTLGNMQNFGHTKRMAENHIQFVWERPEIEVLVY